MRWLRDLDARVTYKHVRVALIVLWVGLAACGAFVAYGYWDYERSNPMNEHHAPAP